MCIIVNGVADCTGENPKTKLACNLNCIQGYYSDFDSSGNCICVPNSSLQITNPSYQINNFSQICTCNSGDILLDDGITCQNTSFLSCVGKICPQTTAITKQYPAICKTQKPCNMICIQGYTYGYDSSGNCICVPESPQESSQFIELPYIPPCNINCDQGYTNEYDSSGNCICVQMSSQFIPKICNMDCISTDTYGTDASGNCICVPKSSLVGIAPVSNTSNNEVYYIIGFISLIIIFLIIYYFMTKG